MKNLGDLLKIEDPLLRKKRKWDEFKESGFMTVAEAELIFGPLERVAGARVPVFEEAGTHKWVFTIHGAVEPGYVRTHRSKLRYNLDDGKLPPW